MKKNLKRLSMIRSGQYIKSNPALNGTYFENAVILIVEKNKDGAIGFITNRSLGRSLNELVEFSQSKAFPIMEGGPVDQEHLFVVHRRPELISGGVFLPNGSYYGGSIQDVLQAINKDNISENDLKLFIGYCGWDAGELEDEIAEGSWSIHNENPTF